MTNTEYMRIWRQKNHKRYREICNKAWKKFATNNPDKIKLSREKWRNNARFGGLRDLVLKRDIVCTACKTGQSLTVDHIDRNRLNNTLSNLQVLCRSCHGLKDGQARNVRNGWKFKRIGKRGIKEAK